ncbi:MAG: adenylate/guanylate cyclase domain-containing protein [Candidatus Ozemobacteraceae bacterium]
MIAGKTVAPEGMRRFLLPLILSLIPFFLLSADVKGSKNLQLEDARRRRLEEVRQIGERFPDITTPEFWAEETARRLKNGVEKTLLAASETQELLASSLNSALLPAHPQGISGGQLWAAYLPPDFSKNLSVGLLQGVHLETKIRVIFAQLLRDLARDYLRQPNDLDRKEIIQRLKSTFGESSSRKLFAREHRGKAFNVVFQGEFGIAVWNIIRGRDRPIGVFFLILPTSIEASKIARNAAFLNWKALFPHQRIRPAFIPFQVSPGKKPPSPVLHKDVAHSLSARRMARRLQREMRIVVRKGPPRSGFPMVPTDSLLKPMTEGPFWGVPCCAAPLSEGIGLLLTPIPTAPILVTERLTVGYGLFLAVFWPLFLSWTACGGRLSPPGVRLTLLLWFAGLAATPVALILGSSERLQLDLASNLRDELDREISSHLRKIDTGSARLDIRYGQVCRSLSSLPKLGERLEECRSHPENGRKILEDLWRRCPSEMSVQTILLVGHGGFRITRSAPECNSEVASSTTWFHQAIAEEFLRNVAPLRAKEWDKKQTKASFASTFSRMGVLDANKDFLSTPDTVTIFSVGTTQPRRYFSVIRHAGKIEYALFVFWNQDEAFIPYLREALGQALRDRPDIALAAYRRTPDGRELVARAGDPRHLALMMGRIKPWGVPSEADGIRMALYPAQKMSNFLLAAGAPMEALDTRISAERLTSAVSLTLLAIMIFGGALLLSNRLAAPILRMTWALVRISRNDLDVRVDEGRLDELGDAARTLDTMTERLRERCMMSRFVAPQVREVVAQGDLDKAVAGTERHVALLVSDVRSFTTMSETYPPEAIFDLINGHLKVMTTVIQKHGGAIDRFIGDAIQAVFYPGPGEPMVNRALQAAREMMDAHIRFNRERLAAGLFEYRVGIGVELGTVVTGVLGDPDVRLDFTVLGEPMKHCADLEGASKFGKATRIVCSREVRSAAGEAFSFIPLADPDHQDTWEMAGPDVYPSPLALSGTTSPNTLPPPLNHASPPLSPIISHTDSLALSPTESLAPSPTESLAQSFPDTATVDSYNHTRQNEDNASSDRSAQRIMPNATNDKPLQQSVSSLDFSSSSTSDSSQRHNVLESQEEARYKPLSPGEAFALLGFLMLPLLLLGGAFHSLEVSRTLQHRQDLLAGLDEDRRKAEAGLDPLGQISFELFKRLNNLARRTTSLPEDVLSATPKIVASIIAPNLANHSPKPLIRQDVTKARNQLRKQVIEELTMISPRLGSPSWYFFEHQPEQVSNTRDATQQSSVLVASGGATVAPGLTDEFVMLFYTVLKNRLLETFDLAGYKWFENQAQRFLGVSTINSPFYQALGQLIQLSPFGRTRYFYWYPILDPAFWQEFERLPPTRKSEIFDSGSIERHFRGALLFFIEPSVLTPENGRRALVENLAKGGCVSAFQPLEYGQKHLTAHRAFMQNSVLRMHLPEPWSNMGKITQDSFKKASPALSRHSSFRKSGLPAFWELIKSIVPGRPTVRILLARTSGNVTTPFPRARKIFLVLGGIWLCLGLYAAFAIGLLGRPLRLDLRTQLGGTFLFILIPTIIIGALSIERSHSEREVRLQHDQRRLLQDTAAAVEDTYHMYLAWSEAISQNVVVQPGFLGAAAHVERGSEKDFDRVGKQIMREIQRTALRRGAFMNRPMISGMGSLCLILEDGNSSAEIGIVQKFLRTLIVRTLKSLKTSSAATIGGGDRKTTGEEMVMGLGLEEVSSLVLSFVEPQFIMSMVLAPRTLVQTFTFGEQDYLYRRFLPGEGGGFRYGFMVNLTPSSFLYLILNRWSIVNRTRDAGFLPTLGYCLGQGPAFMLVHPFKIPSFGTGHGIKFDDQIMPQVPDIAEAAFWTKRSDSPIFQRRKTGNEEELLLTMSPPGISNSILTLTSPIGRLLREQASDAAGRRGILLLLLVAVIFFAERATRRFLSPIRELSVAADSITAGRFDVRLRDDQGGEFGILARAFNAMATGVSEGRMLSRFVSESVRDAAGSTARAEAAHRGEQRNVTVIFAGLADFKHLLVHTPPDILIDLLNRYLQTMSRAIRAQGGEIDKFIGDKILAVFPHDSLGGKEKAALRAVIAATGMRLDHERLRQELRGALPNHLGVGVVAGTVLAGIMGTPDVRLEYTVIGDTVNLASRLGDLALRIDAEGIVRPDSTGCCGAVVVEADVAEDFRKHSPTKASERLYKLKLPPIKGKTRSVEAFLVRDKISDQDS